MFNACINRERILKNGGERMRKPLVVKMNENDLELLQKMAKASGKTFSQYVREIIAAGLKQEIRETNLLSKLITKLETLETNTHNNTINSSTEFKDIKQMLLLLIESYKLLAKFVVLVPDKQKEFLRLLSEIEQKMRELV